MVNSANQGDIIILEDKNIPLLVVSKNIFNETGQVLVCPIINNKTNSPIHVYIEGRTVVGEVYCEQIRHLDIVCRRYRRIDEIGLNKIMPITDIIQGLVDYI